MTFKQSTLLTNVQIVDEMEKQRKSISIANQFFSIYWCNATPIANLLFYDCVETALTEQQRNMNDDHHVLTGNVAPYHFDSIERICSSCTVTGLGEYL